MTVFPTAQHFLMLSSIVPLPYYQQERQVLSIMLEVNRRLYLTPENEPRPAALA